MNRSRFCAPGLRLTLGSHSSVDGHKADGRFFPELRTHKPMNKFTGGRNFVFGDVGRPPEPVAVGAQVCSFAKWLVLAMLILFVLASPVRAMTINVTYDSSVTGLTNATQVEAAVATVVQTFQSLYTNAITVNITVSFSSGVQLGQSSTSEVGNPAYNDLVNALSASSTTAADSNSVASLPVSDPTF